MATNERPSLQARALVEPIDVDGDLSDAAWAGADRGAGFVQREPRDGEPSSETTEFAVAFTPSTLYVAVWAHDSDPAAIIAKQMEKDADLSQDDSILIVLDTFLDGRNSYGFSTNANGARTDTLVTDEGRDVNRNWDGVWAVGARRTDWGWSAEIAIPFSTLRFDRSLDTWGLNVERRIRRKNEETHWAPMPRETGAFNSSAAYRVSLAGRAARSRWDQAVAQPRRQTVRARLRVRRSGRASAAVGAAEVARAAAGRRPIPTSASTSSGA